MQLKEILKGNEARKKIKDGIDKASDAVKPTLGAIGMTAIIEYKGLDPIECDDGVTILKNLEFKDPYENLGLQKLRKGAIRTSTEGGDGTATTTVLTQAFVNDAFKEIASDSSRIREVRERLQRGLTQIIDELSKIKRTVTMDDIEKIALISSLDPEVSKLIADIIKEVGVNGIVTVEKDSRLGYTSEVVKGARFEKGLISQYFINDHANERCVLENPYIALIDRKVSLGAQIKSLMEDVAKTGNRSILIIADDVDGIALASLIQASKTIATVNAQGQQMQGTYDIACVRNPYTATPSKDFLKDMSALTGATVISEEAGMKLSDANVAQLGQAERVLITKDTTTIIGCKPSLALETRINVIKKELEETTSEVTKAMLKDRLAMLTGGIGVIRVGAYTDTEFNAKKYKFENAINSAQSALQEGILPGGGVALASIQIADPLFRKALHAPIKQMAINAGMEQENGLALPPNMGFDFRTKKMVDMFEAGIIDPFKVTRLALESAVAITSSLINIETAIVDEDKVDSNTSD